MTATCAIEVRWGKHSYVVDVDLDLPGAALKAQLFSLTAVPMERIKVTGLRGGKILSDESDMRECGIEELARKGKKLMMFGSAVTIEAPKGEMTFVEDLPEREREAATTANYSPGLVNLGNTCYMNSVLQCLYAAKELRSVLEGYVGGRDQHSGSAALTTALRELFADVKRARDQVMPVRFLNVLRQLYPQFAQHGAQGAPMQQDAEECWTAVMQTLNAEIGGDVKRLFGVGLRRELKCAATGETRVEESDEFTFKCNITIDVNHVTEGFKIALNDTRELRSEALGSDAIFEGASRISRLPEYLTTQLVRFYYKTDIRAKAKILRAVTFPVMLDVYEFCTEELKAELDPARKLKLKREDDEALQRMNAKKAALDATGADAVMSDAGAVSSDAAGSQTAAASDVTAADAPPATAIEDIVDPLEGTRFTGFYDLIAVLTHKGRSADSGHYVSWVKQPDGKWTEFDDETPIPKTEDDVLALKGGGDHHMGYLMLYRARKI